MRLPARPRQTLFRKPANAASAPFAAGDVPVLQKAAVNCRAHFPAAVAGHQVFLIHGGKLFGEIGLQQVKFNKHGGKYRMILLKNDNDNHSQLNHTLSQDRPDRLYN